MTSDASIVDRGAPYRDADLAIEDRVEDLLARMLPEEKVAQLGSAWMFELVRGEEIDDDRASAICRHGLGQITRIAGASTLTADKVAGVANALQRRLVEGTRLGIPAIVHEEICSGLMARGSTVYPQAIGVASTFEPDLNAEMADGIRVQMRKAGAHQGLSPVLDVVRDPRWGRTEETYGEDAYVVARMGTAFVEGLQGSDLAEGVIATAKHFVGYGASEGGMNWAPAHLPERELREVFLHPFEAAVRLGGLESVMNGYHELDGVPCAANEHLLTGLLRGSWGFDGIVVSDYFSVDQLATYHRLARSKAEAAVLALGAGIDVELPSSDCFAEPLLTAVERGDADTTACGPARPAAQVRVGLVRAALRGRDRGGRGRRHRCASLTRGDHCAQEPRAPAQRGGAAARAGAGHHRRHRSQRRRGASPAGRLRVPGPHRIARGDGRRREPV
jgi:beta-glucosidase